MGVSYVKFCPRCQTTTGVDAAICPNCGHQYRTHFQPPVSEKTIAMTAVPQAERPSNAGPPSAEDDSAPLPVFRPRLILLGVIVLAVIGVVYGVLTRHAQEPSGVNRRPAASQAFRPYTVTLQGSGGTSTPVATQSTADLQQWGASSAHPAKPGDAAAGDDPAHVHLYLSKRILLVPTGTPARVLREQDPWRRIQILGGPDAGKTGFVGQGNVTRDAVDPTRGR